MVQRAERAVSRTRDRGCGPILALTAFAAACALASGSAAEETLSRPVASYEIRARLDPGSRTVEGHALLRWRNATKRAASDLCLHLYLNAFANNRTTFLRSSPEAVARWAKRYPGEWGGIDIDAIDVRDEDVTDEIEFIRPDDENADDRTLARLPLRRPVPPGQTVEVGFDFRARLPRLFARSGHAAPYFLVAQWFPKVGVFEDGKWNCHQYHDTTEFYADFGTYDVSLTVPAEYVVGHTGVRRAERDNGDGTKTIEAHADDVHDFAWAADPRFRVVEESVDGVSVRLLLQPPHLGQGARYLDALRAALRFYARWFGPYPYAALTLVDPGPGAFASAGMEYPMLITAGTTWWMPRGVRLPEMLAIHEFGHQYWYGLVASDEVTSPWLDEGLNSYVEGVIMDETYGERSSYVDFLGLRFDATALLRLRYLLAPARDPIVTPAHLFVDHRSYASVAYAKTALVLRTLERMAGREKVLTALGEYHRAWRFRHPRSADLIAALRPLAGEERAEFLRRAIEETDVLDYAVSSLEVRRVAPLAGRGIDADGEVPPRADAYRAEVVVDRRGELRSPVDVVVAFDDGSETRESWDGEARWRRFEITSNVEAAYAVVDPARKLALDVDRIGDSSMREPGTRGVVRLAGRWGLWMQGLLHLLTAW